EYGFGPSDLPRTYALVEQRILELNGLAAPERALAGPLLMPSLPRRVRPDPAGLDQFPAVASLRIVPRAAGIDMQTASMDDLLAERAMTVQRRRAAGVSLDVPLPL